MPILRSLDPLLLIQHTLYLGQARSQIGQTMPKSFTRNFNFSVEEATYSGLLRNAEVQTDSKCQQKDQVRSCLCGMLLESSARFRRFIIKPWWPRKRCGLRGTVELLFAFFGSSSIWCITHEIRFWKFWNVWNSNFEWLNWSNNLSHCRAAENRRANN